jgi:hypothetical protein
MRNAPAADGWYAGPRECGIVKPEMTGRGSMSHAGGGRLRFSETRRRAAAVQEAGAAELGSVPNPKSQVQSRNQDDKQSSIAISRRGFRRRPACGARADELTQVVDISPKVENERWSFICKFLISKWLHTKSIISTEVLEIPLLTNRFNYFAMTCAQVIDLHKVISETIMPLQVVDFPPVTTFFTQLSPLSG